MEPREESSSSTEYMDQDRTSSCVSADWLAELSDSELGDDEPVAADDTEDMERCAQTARMFKLRRTLGQLDHFHQQKEQDVLTAREELKLCCQHIEELLEQRDQLENEIKSQKAAENSAVVFRLRAQHKRLCEELQSEEELETTIRAALRKHQLELCEAEVELARVSSLRQEVQDKEQHLHIHRQQKAMTRLQQERQASSNRYFKFQQQRDKQTSQKNKDSEVKKMTNKNTARFIRETMLRVQRQEADREQQSRELVENRSQAVRSLQSNIAATHESIRLQQSRSKANAQKEEREESRLRAGGTGSGRHVLEQQQKQREFKERQKSKRLEIISKILQEEQQQKRKKKQQVAQSKAILIDRAPEWARPTDSLLESLDPSPPLPLPLPSPPPTNAYMEQCDSEDSDSATSDPDELEEDKIKSLEQPEFCGLWTHQYKEAHKKPALVQTEAVQNKHATTNEKFNTSAKKVPKKETRQPPFSSKPEIILFKDFEVKQIYEKKVILTNISYSTNYCRFLGVSAPLKDFMSISFELPGSLSTGMSCDLQAVFQPLLNEDLEGAIQFVTATAPFSVPVKCTTRKCQVEVDSKCIDFGSHVVGQTVSRTITLTNRGALASLFSLDMSDRSCPESSPVPLPPCDPACTHQEANCEKKQCEHEKRHESGMEAAEAQLKLEAGTEAHSDQDTADVSDSSDSTCDIHFGSVTEGEIRPFQSIKLEVIFKPTIPGETKLIFYIRFSDRSSQTIAVQVKAAAVSVPVWVAHPTIDLKICLWDHLYHHGVYVHSRANTALKLTFEVCPELRNHMDIVPKTGFVQAKSSFKAQLKFLPRQSLPEDASGMFDRDTGVLEVPLVVQVTGQPVFFTVTAVLTSSDLSLDLTHLDFGPCSVHQSVRSSVRLTNLSLLPQDFGFYNIPEFIEVQPNNGFGTLLPQETLHIDLIFRARKAKVYNFQLSCKSGLNRDLVLSCQALGVRPPLELSHSLVQFGATAVGHSSSALLYVINTERPPAPAGPRLFCFHVPEQSDVSVSPAAGCLLPGERCSVQLTFRPILSELELKTGGSKTPTEAEDAPAEASRGRGVDMTSEEKHAACLLLRRLSSFSQRHPELTVACSVSEPTHGSASEQPPSWSPINMLYLKLLCPAIQPPLVVISSSGWNTVDFHQVTVGETVIQKCVVQNISKESLALSSSVLAVGGPFSVLNALRPLRPGQSHPLLLGFRPALAKQYREQLEVRSCRGGLWLTLCGEGMLPEVTCSHSGPVLDFGYVLVKESTSQLLKLQNHSAVEVGFRALLSSQSPSTPQGGTQKQASRGTDILPLLQRRPRPAAGVASVFSVVPAEGRLAPGQSQDIRVGFHPDHEYEFYWDCLTVKLSDQSEVCVVDLKGVACSCSMYVSGGDPLTPPYESPLAPGKVQLTEEDSIPLLVTLKARHSTGVWAPIVRELQVGCVRSTQPNKKSAEFCWDNVGSVQQQGFNVEPSKGVVEPGSTRTVSITWNPPSGYKPYDVMQSTVSLTLKADNIRVHKVTLMALVSNDL